MRAANTRKGGEEDATSDKKRGGLTRSGSSTEEEEEGIEYTATLGHLMGGKRKKVCFFGQRDLDTGKVPTGPARTKRKARGTKNWSTACRVQKVQGGPNSVGKRRKKIWGGGHQKIQPLGGEGEVTR